MRYYFFLVFFALLLNSVKGQDLIVTNDGDSINCKISKIDDAFVYYLDNSLDGMIKSIKPKGWMHSYSYDFYASNKGNKKAAPKHSPYSRWRFTLGGGYSYQMAAIRNSGHYQVKSEMDGLRSGTNIMSDVIYFPFEQIGIGVKGIYFHTSNKTNYYDLTATWSDKTSPNNISDDISIIYVGPSIQSRFYFYNYQNVLSFNLSAGYLSYRNKMGRIDNYTITGNSFAGLLELGYTIGYTDKWGIFVKGSLFFSTLSKQTVSEDTKTTTSNLQPLIQNNLNRVDLSAGVVYSIY